MMYSFHSQLLFNGSSETIDDFKQAIGLEPIRKAGHQTPLAVVNLVSCFIET